MKFWDSSALVPLLIEEELSPRLRQLYLQEDQLVTWWGSEVECASAIARVEREGKFPLGAATEALQRLETLVPSWQRVAPIEDLRQTAKRFLQIHPLRASDALQLAAAFVASEARPPTLGFVCMDERLCNAAQREGFPLVDRSNLHEVLSQ